MAHAHILLANEKQHILVVDDDQGIQASLAAFLRRTGFEVSTASDGVQALALLDRLHPDLVVLDVLMPRLDGRETLRRLRRAENWMPVILLTQIGDAAERAMALEEGADDYINKPFDPHELVARIRAVLRRTHPGTPPLSAAWVLVCGELRLDRRARRVSLGGHILTLTPKALILLEYLMTHPDELISRERLLDVVWGWEAAVATRAVDARIAELRRALQDSRDQPVYIETVSGLGYRFVGEVEQGR
jgi:DNA-binding response OmpR family regulator